MTPFAIAGRAIGPGHPPYVIAELAGNHNGDLNRALAVVLGGVILTGREI